MLISFIYIGFLSIPLFYMQERDGYIISRVRVKYLSQLTLHAHRNVFFYIGFRTLLQNCRVENLFDGLGSAQT